MNPLVPPVPVCTWEKCEVVLTPENQSYTKRGNTLSKYCTEHRARDLEKSAKKKRKVKSTLSATHSPSPAPSTSSKHPRGAAQAASHTILSLEGFLTSLKAQYTAKASKGASYLVDGESFDLSDEMSRVDKADEVREMIQSVLPWKFNYHRKQKATARDGTITETFVYFCRQRHDKLRINGLTSDKENRRDRTCMDRFPCYGELTIAVNSNNNNIYTQLIHNHHHEPYCDISLPDIVKKMITDQDLVPVKQIWKQILREIPSPEFTRKQVRTEWARVNSAAWKLDDNPQTSAKMVLEKFEGKEVEVITVREEPGLAVVAFAVKCAMDDWAGEVVEVAIDGTFNTNAQRYEISALIGEANGQGIPLGFILHVSTDGTAVEGAKERALDDFLRYFAQKCPRVKFTLSDKEISEVNAMRTAFPSAKHVLCYWHAIHAVERRLAVNSPPAPYNPIEAHRCFDFIDPTWAPGVSAPEKDARVDEESGSVQPRREGEDEKEFEQLKKAVRESCRPPRMIVVCGNRRIPIWPSPPQVKKADLPENFCEAEHRPVLIEKFRRSGCQHPLIPTQLEDGSVVHMSEKEIWTAAVHDTYQYCYEHNLSQAWAYLWNCWYRREKWVLWARSASDEISVLRTTMIVEGFWNKLKHTTIGDFTFPPLSLLIHLIIVEIIPDIKLRLDLHLNRRRQGRAKTLYSWQAHHKARWRELSASDEDRLRDKEADVLSKKKKTTAWKQQHLDWIRQQATAETGVYATSLADWTCSCPAYLVDRFLLCKHIVRASNAYLESNNCKMTLQTWYELRRERTTPFYRIPGINADLSASSADDISEPPLDELEGPVGSDESGGSSSVPPLLPDEDRPIISSADLLSMRDLVHVDGNDKAHFLPVFKENLKRSIDELLQDVPVHPRFALEIVKICRPMLNIAEALSKRRRTGIFTWINVSKALFWS